MTVSDSHTVGKALLDHLEALPDGVAPELYFVVPDEATFKEWKKPMALPDAKVHHAAFADLA